MNTNLPKNKFTRSNTKTKIIKHDTHELRPDGVLYPTITGFEMTGLGDEYFGKPIWENVIYFEVGLDRTNCSFEYFRNQEDANRYISNFPVGTILSEKSDFIPFDMWGEDGSRALTCGLFFSAGGDGPESSIYDCLVGAGVLGDGFRLSDHVLEWAGAQKLEWAEQNFGENGSAAIQMDYCANHFPRSSLAHIAARIHFATYISGDDFTAGYLSRELEQLVGGVQELAESALLTRHKAGEAGSRASQSKRLQRLEAFFDEVEKLSDLVGRISEQVILDQAFENAIKRDPELWKQGKGQQAEYETFLRSADQFKDRYFALMAGSA